MLIIHHLVLLQANGTAAPSCAASLIEHNDIDEDQMKWISSTFYAAGTDTVHRPGHWPGRIRSTGPAGSVLRSVALIVGTRSFAIGSSISGSDPSPRSECLSEWSGRSRPVAEESQAGWKAPETENEVQE